MRIEQVNYLSDEEYRLVTILRDLGFTKTTACVLVYLANIEEVSSRDIERGTGLRQPEVSLAIKEMDAWGWIAQQEHKNPGPGRRIKHSGLLNRLQGSLPISTTRNERRRRTFSFWSGRCGFMFPDNPSE